MTQFIRRHGLLFAAGLCVAATGFAAAFTVNSRLNESIQPLQDSGISQVQQKEETDWQNGVTETPVAKNQTGVQKSSEKQSGSSKSSTGGTASSGASKKSAGVSDGATSSLPDTALAVPHYAQPVAGEVTADFSGEELRFDVTMQDWRTHNGTDFAATYGDAVCSITAGTVTEVREDVLWGTVVTVQGEEGLLRYAGLAKKTQVKQGQTVAAGEVLGKLDELPGEIALEPHLHVEYEVNGQLQDVMTLLNG